jgi:gas vesicle protein
MQEEKNISVYKIFKIFITGAFIGIAIGYFVGLLKAPQTGEKFQKELKEKLDKFFKNLKAKKRLYEPKVKEFVSGMSSKTVGLYEQVKEQIIEKSTIAKKNLTKQRFEKIVDDVINDLKKKHVKYAWKLDEIGHEFKKSWDEIKRILRK